MKLEKLRRVPQEGTTKMICMSSDKSLIRGPFLAPSLVFDLFLIFHSVSVENSDVLNAGSR